ncbi:hypothetical protein FQN54_005492 [Arachnomyces sp. PD_36]|nr:hypothetical protein FQN54_005492 [Arachnomyces sp. PD_36]
MNGTRTIAGNDASRMREIGSSQTLFRSSSRYSVTDGSSISTSATEFLSIELDRHISAIRTSPADEVITWSGPDDLQNPRNWNSWTKFSNLTVISSLAFITLLASSIFAPAVPHIMKEFGSDSEPLRGFVVSVYLLGYAIGPLILAPMSELYGRLWVYHICNLGFLGFTVGCALSPNIAALTVFRFFEGCFGSAPLTISGGTIADLIAQENRGGVSSVFAIGSLLGPALGPVIGGYLTVARGWRFLMAILAFISGLFTLIALCLLRESNPAAILERKAEYLRRETGNLSLRSELGSDLTAKKLFWRSIARPAKLFIFSPIVSLCSFYTGVIYAYQYLLYTTFSAVFVKQYNFSTSGVGLTFLGSAVGSLLGLICVGLVSDRILRAKAKPNAESPTTELKPEYRLPALLPVAAIIPIGLFMYGWTTEYKVHWMAPIVGTGIFGFGCFGGIICIWTYTIDTFQVYAASALAVNTVIRSVMGAVLPLAGDAMYDDLGPGWATSVLGFVALVLIPVPWWMMRYGERLREKFDFKRL